MPMTVGKGCTVAAWAALLFLVSGCGENQTGSKPPGSPPVSAATSALPPMPQSQQPPQPEVAPDPSTASISGQITFEGIPPPRKALSVESDKLCAAIYKDTPLLSEELIVDAPTKGLQNAFVYIQSGFGNRQFSTPKQPVVFAAEKCRFTPHVAGAMLYQEFEISMSSDQCMHAAQVSDVEFCSDQSSVPQFTYHEPKMGIPIKCKLHGWMLAYVCYVDNPYFTVTGLNGRFTLNHVPPGTYQLAVWHEKLGEQVQSITVPEAQAATAQFTFAIKPAAK